MTVAELIKDLQAFRSDSEVVLLTFNKPGLPDGWWHHHPSEQVETYGHHVAIVAQS